MLLQMLYLLGTTLQVLSGILDEDYVEGEGEPRIRNSFYYAAQTYSQICSVFENEGVHKCCGFCTYDTECFKHGSCCLYKYGNFTHGRDSVNKTRYDCVVTQYLTNDDTDFNIGKAFWMITRCDPEFMNTVSAELCTHPGQQLERVVPVTEPVTNRHYKNRNCAYCNGVETDKPLINWKLQIRSNQHLSFPDNDLLHKIRATRGNIFFKKPEYVKTFSCDPVPEYTIDACNQTGLWMNHDETTKEACDAFVDPFNYTYKNYFCYLCNVATPASLDDTICPSKQSSQSLGPPTPRFVAELDLYTILDESNQESLVCKGTQFTDEHLMVCRDVFCHKHRSLDNGDCKSSFTLFSDTCFSVFIKMTPFPETRPPKLVMIEKSVLKENIEVRFRAYHALRQERSAESSNGIKQDFIFFFKETENGYLEYIIVHVDTVFQNSGDKNEFIENLILTKSINAFYGSDMEYGFIAFAVDLEVYDVSKSGKKTKLFVPNGETMSKDEVLSDSEDLDTNICENKERIQIRLLHVCPYIELTANQKVMRKSFSIFTDRLSVKIENDFLIISDTVFGRVMKVLSKWKYEEHDDVFYICLNDYLDIYHALTKLKTDTFSAYSGVVCQRLGDPGILCLFVNVCIYFINSFFLDLH